MTQHKILEKLINPEIDVYFLATSITLYQIKTKYVLALIQFSETFVSIVGKEMFLETQFHPEKKSYPAVLDFQKL